MSERLRAAARILADIVAVDAVERARRDYDDLVIAAGITLHDALEEEERIIELMKSEAGEDVTVVGGLIDKMGDGSSDVLRSAPDKSVSRCDGSGTLRTGTGFRNVLGNEIMQIKDCPGCPACRKEKP